MSAQEAHARDISPLRLSVRLDGEAAVAMRALDARSGLNINAIVGSALILFEHMSRPGASVPDTMESAIEMIKKIIEGAR